MLHFGGLFPQGSLCPRRQGGDVFAPLPGAHGWRKREASSWEMRKRGVLRRWECPAHLPSSKEGFSLFFAMLWEVEVKGRRKLLGVWRNTATLGKCWMKGYGAPPACLGAAGGDGGMSQPWGLFLYVPGQGCSWQHPGHRYLCCREAASSVWDWPFLGKNPWGIWHVDVLHQQRCVLSISVSSQNTEQMGACGHSKQSCPLQELFSGLVNLREKKK